MSDDLAADIDALAEQFADQADMDMPVMTGATLIVGWTDPTDGHASTVVTTHRSATTTPLEELGLLAFAATCSLTPTD